MGSGATTRPQREKLIEAARRREINLVLVWRLDRWGRSLVDLVNTLQELNALDVGFVSLCEALDLTTPSGRALAGMLAVFAEFERDILREPREGGNRPSKKGWENTLADETGRHSNMISKKTLYLANPYGFSPQQREGPLAALVAALEAMGAEVWEPFARNNQIDRAGAGWAYEIGQADLRDVREADGLFAVVNGCPPDEGVMVELGLAIAWEKPVFLFRDDFRRCTDSEAYPLNLMLFTGLPEMGWDAYWYSSAQEIADPDKALSRWLKDGVLPGSSPPGGSGPTT